MELLGFDVLLDKTGKPWLLEVNHSPSLAADSAVDEAVKGGVVEAVLRLMAVQPAARARERAQSRQQVRRALLCGCVPCDIAGGPP